MKAISKSVKQATDKPDELLDWDGEDALLLAALSPLWLASLKEGFETVNNLYSFGLSFDLFNPKFLDWIDKFGLKTAKGINKTTKDALSKTLSEGIANGEGIPKLKKRIESIYSDAKGYRANTIAKTETHNTVGVGTQETYIGAGVQQKEWLSTKDSRTRDSHILMDGEVVGINQTFSNGLMFPGDPTGPAEEVVNCRCVLLPVLE